MSVPFRILPTGLPCDTWWRITSRLPISLEANSTVPPRSLAEHVVPVKRPARPCGLHNSDVQAGIIPSFISFVARSLNRESPTAMAEFPFVGTIELIPLQTVLSGLTSISRV